MPLKPALSIKDQIALLQKRGMIVDNESIATSFLESNQYYRLNIYFHKFMDSPDHFCGGSQFSQIIATYENDRWLRNKILTILEPIEIRTRTQIAHYLGIMYGSDAFYKTSIYKNASFYHKIFDNFSAEVNRNPLDPVINHHKIHYGGQFPIWVVVEYLSFNSLSKYFSNLQEIDKKAIAKSSYKINDHLFGQWLHVLSVLRNICAHYGYLFRRDYSLRPIIAREFGWDAAKNDSLFALFLVLRRLSEREIWNNFILELIEREKSQTFFLLRDYGFPDNWGSYLTDYPSAHHSSSRL